MLTSNVILGYQGLPIRDFLCFFLCTVFSPIGPTDPISGNAFDAKRKRGGMALLPSKNLGLSQPSCSVEPNEYIHIFLPSVY